MTDFLAAYDRALQVGDQANAYRMLLAALDGDGENPDLWYRMGVLLGEMKQHRSAVAAFARADNFRPNDHKILVNLALSLGLCRRYDEGDAALLRAIDADPSAPLGHVHRSNLLYAKGNLKAATAHARMAVGIDPDSALAHMQLAFCLCAEGKWREGLAEYEWRFKYLLTEFLSYPYPLWRGEETGTLLIVGEQGLGDAIMMMRYVGAASRRVGKVIWLVHGELRRLAYIYKDSSHRIDILPMPHPVPAADAFCPMMSLPVALGIEWVGENDTPYIKSTLPHLAFDNNLRVGIAWAGSPNHVNARHRDIPLEEFLPLAEIPGISLFSLQVGERRVDLDRVAAHSLIGDLSGQISDMADTAQLIAGLDLVICCDTAVGHLAGAMGKEVWLLLDEGSRDWRWGKDDERTPWYPAMTLIERRIGQEWAEVFRRVGDALRQRVEKSLHDGCDE